MEPSLRSIIQSAKAPPDAGFQPFFDESQGPYRARFATSPEDLEAAFRLRYEIFNLELGEGLAESVATGLDRDPFDDQCDHLLVEEISSGRVIGTYRLQVLEMAEAGEGFYTATEFDLSLFPREVLEEGVECGRACITRAHRNKKVLYLLWRGLASYVLWNGRRYLFGCSSLTSQDPALGLRAYEQLQADGHTHPELFTRPIPGYECIVDGPLESNGRVEIPALFGTYLRSGVQICGPPAIDRFFGTIDFLILFDLHRIAPRVLAMFFMNHVLRAPEADAP